MIQILVFFVPLTLLQQGEQQLQLCWQESHLIGDDASKET